MSLVPKYHFINMIGRKIKTKKQKNILRRTANLMQAETINSLSFIVAYSAAGQWQRIALSYKIMTDDRAKFCP